MFQKRLHLRLDEPRRLEMEFRLVEDSDGSSGGPGDQSPNRTPEQSSPKEPSERAASAYREADGDVSSEVEERRARRGRSGTPESEPESEAPSVERPPDGQPSRKEEAQLLPPQDLWDRCVTPGCMRYAVRGWDRCCMSCKKFEGKRHGPQCQANSSKPTEEEVGRKVEAPEDLEVARGTTGAGKGTSHPATTRGTVTRGARMGGTVAAEGLRLRRSTARALLVDGLLWLKASSHRTSLDGGFSQRREEPGGSFVGRTTTSLLPGRPNLRGQ